MLDFLTRKKVSPIALDLGSTGVRLMQLVRDGDEIRVTASAQGRLEGPLPDDAGQRREVLAAKITSLLKDAPFRGRSVVSALPSSGIHIKNVRLARQEPDQLDETVLAEASERFSFSVGPDELRYINAGAVKDGTEVRDEIVMIATPADVVEDHLATLRLAKLTPECIETELTALFRAYERRLRRRSDSETVTTTIDVGESSTRLVVAKGRHILFLKRIDIGGADLDEAVSQQLNLSVDEAHDLRHQLMSEPDRTRNERGGAIDLNEEMDEASQTYWAVYDGMREKAISLAREISLCLRYCSVTFRGLRMDDITITGGQANDKALVEVFAEHVGGRCEVGRPLQGIDVSSSGLQAERRGALSEWSVCTGLAVRGLELSETAREHAHAQHRLSA
jgi:type IV pilus assembly protein PilM